MMTATGIRPVAPRGIVSVAPSPSAPLLIVYAVSIAAAGAVVSARAGAAAWTNAAMIRLGMITLLSLPEDVGLHDGNPGREDDRDHPHREERASRGESRRRDHEAGDHEQPAGGAMHPPPHAVAREGPGRADTDEPVRLDARQVVAQEREQQPDAYRQ